MWLPRTSVRARAGGNSIGHGLDLRHERARRVDNEAGLDPALLAPLVEFDGVTIGKRRDRGNVAAVLDIGATRARIEKDRERQPRIVRHAVAIVQNRHELLLPEPGKLDDIVVIEPAACRQAVAKGQSIV